MAIKKKIMYVNEDDFFVSWSITILKFDYLIINTYDNVYKQRASIFEVYKCIFPAQYCKCIPVNDFSSIEDKE